MEKVLFFGGKWGCFSNMSSFIVYWRGTDWYTSEHAYMAAKFSDPDIVQKIKHARSGFAAKDLAAFYAERIDPDWDSKKLQIMEEIVRAKLAQHSFIQKKLLATGVMEIVEDSPTDSYWGRGADWQGENHLGKIWMKLREELQGQASK